MKRQIQSLNGLWDYRIADGTFSKKQIPYSDPPVGFAECQLRFDANTELNGKRSFLVFDGITYSADVVLNGKTLGTMRPYCEYRYEITDLIYATDNLLSVTVRDTEVVFGPGEGWENYSGITRDVSVEYTDFAVLEDVFWHATLSSDLKVADCTAEIKVDSSTSEALACRITLSDPHGRIVHTQSETITQSEAKISFLLQDPSLWSPQSPALYTLKAELIGKETIDERCERIGFKDFTTKGKRFYLNGEPFFLLGVCRHELYGDAGHMITDEQIREDLKMIKELGCNYVRLVHYPHRKITLDIADELGLFVSEEPGLWWSDMKNQEIFDGGLEVLRRTILRDRNHTCIAFWLSFNECIFTPEFIRASASVCRQYDPYRMVSGANCMDIPMTKQYFKECGFDFYTMHPYAPKTDKMWEAASELNDMPLVFTEWGGYYVHDNPASLKWFINDIVKLWKNPDDQPVLTGASIWSFAEIFEFNRAAPACLDGILHEGLVDRYRNPNVGFDLFKEGFRKLYAPVYPKTKLTTWDFDEPIGRYQTIDLEPLVNTEEQSKKWAEAMALGARHIPRFYYVVRGVRNMERGPILPERITALGTLPTNLCIRPAVINANEAFSVELNEKAEKIYLVGMTSMPHGFPIEGEFGETAAMLELVYSDATVEKIPLRNGYEITTATAWYGPSRINPVASCAPRALHWIHDMDREHYVANLFAHTLDPSKTLSAIRITAVAAEYRILLYGITLKKA